MHWQEILTILIPLFAFLGWIYNRIDKKFERVDKKFENQKAKISTRFSSGLN